MKTLILLIALSLVGCNSIKPKNLIKNGSTTAVTYAIAGPIPAVATLATSVTIDEVIPEEPKIEEGKSTKQLLAYGYDKTLEYGLYTAIAFFLFTGVISPYFIQRRLIRKKKYNLD